MPGRMQMRTINTELITQQVKEMCMDVNIHLSKDVKCAIEEAEKKEESPLGKQILGQLEENMEIASNTKIPICQDTGMTVVFLKVGQEVHFEGGSVVKDPVDRVNTKDNTPGVIHYEIVPGDQVEITIAPKGFGSENMSRLYMLKPADGLDGIRNAILETVKLAGPNACPPIVVGVGIGGTFEKCAILAKKALTRDLNSSSEIPYVKELEDEMLEKINNLGIGPAGLGGTMTALGVNIETYPTHIAGMPVAINICCHVNRHIRRTI